MTTEVAAALIWEGDRFLLCRRPPHKARGLMWEFAGGKLEPGETAEQALIRECREELDITLEVGPVCLEVLHEYPDITIRLTLFHCRIASGTPKLLEHVDMRWVTLQEAAQFPLSPADAELLRHITPPGPDAMNSALGNVIG